MLRCSWLLLFAVANAADTRRHPGFERFSEGPSCSPVVGPSDVRTASTHAQAPELGPLAANPLHPPGATATKKMQAPKVDIVHLVTWKPAARRHRRFGELHHRPGQGADPTRHSGPGSHRRPRQTRWQERLRRHPVPVAANAGRGKRARRHRGLRQRGAHRADQPPGVPHPAQPAAHQGAVPGVRRRGDQGTHPDRHQPVRRLTVVALPGRGRDDDQRRLPVRRAWLRRPAPAASTRPGRPASCSRAGSAPRRASTPCSRRCTSTSSSSTRGSRSPRRPRARTSRRGRSSSGCSARTPESPWWAAARRRPRWRP